MKALNEVITANIIEDLIKVRISGFYCKGFYKFNATRVDEMRVTVTPDIGEDFAIEIQRDRLNNLSFAKRAKREPIPSYWDTPEKRAESAAADEVDCHRY